MLTEIAWSGWLLICACCLSWHALARRVPHLPPRMLEGLRLLAVAPLIEPSGAYLVLVLALGVLVGTPRERLLGEGLALVGLLFIHPESAPGVGLGLASAITLGLLLKTMSRPPLGLSAPLERWPRVRSLARMLTGCLVLGAPLWGWALGLGLAVPSPWLYCLLTFSVGLLASPWRSRTLAVGQNSRLALGPGLAVGLLGLAGVALGWMLVRSLGESPMSRLIRPLGGLVVRGVAVLPSGVQADELLRLSSEPLKVFHSEDPLPDVDFWLRVAAWASLAGLCLGPSGGSLRYARPAPKVDLLVVEVGHGLALDGPALQELVDSVSGWAAVELGLTLGRVACRHAPNLAAGEYGILLRGQRVAGGEVQVGQRLALTPLTSRVLAELGGRVAPNLPGSLRTGVWVAPDRQDRAQSLGIRLLSGPQLVATHLREVVQFRAADLAAVSRRPTNSAPTSVASPAVPEASRLGSGTAAVLRGPRVDPRPLLVDKLPRRRGQR